MSHRLCDATTPTGQGRSSLTRYLRLLTSSALMACSSDAPRVDPGAPTEGFFEVALLWEVPGSDTTPFASVHDVDVGHDGSVYVLDRLSGTIHRIGDAGQVVSPVGRPGEGPGEFRRPGGLLVDDVGQLWVADTGNGRYQLFQADGELRSVIRRSFPPGFPYPWVASSGPDGQVFERYHSLGPGTPEGRGAYVGLDEAPPGSLIPRDTVHRQPPIEPAVWSVGAGSAGGGATYGGVVTVPFSPASHDVLSRSGHYWHGNTDRAQWTKMSPSGDTVLVITSERFVDRPVTRDVHDQAIDELRSRFGNSISLDVDDVPGRLPLWDVFFVDDAERLWARHFEVPSPEVQSWTWEVYGPSGDWLAEVRLPFLADPTPISRHEVIVGVTEDRVGRRGIAVFAIRPARPLMRDSID